MRYVKETVDSVEKALVAHKDEEVLSQVPDLLRVTTAANALLELYDSNPLREHSLSEAVEVYTARQNARNELRSALKAFTSV